MHSAQERQGSGLRESTTSSARSRWHRELCLLAMMRASFSWYSRSCSSLALAACAASAVWAALAVWAATSCGRAVMRVCTWRARGCERARERERERARAEREGGGQPTAVVLVSKMARSRKSSCRVMDGYVVCHGETKPRCAHGQRRSKDTCTCASGKPCKRVGHWRLASRH